MARSDLHINKIATTHGASYTSEYNSWNSMKSRCYNKNNPKYFMYGAKGIKVCDRWLESFENFLADMGLKSSSKHSIDRYSNKEGDYEPWNC